MKLRSLACALTLVFAYAAAFADTNLVAALTGNEDSSVLVPCLSSLQGYSSTTVEAWVLSAGDVRNPAAAVLNVGDGQTSASDRAYDVRFSPSGILGVEMFFADGSWTSLTTPSATNVWTHVAFTFDSATGFFGLYTNGVLAAATNSMDSIPLQGKTIRQSSQPFIVGGIPNVPGTWFHGSVDEIRIWNKARTQAEIASSAWCPLSGTESNLIAYFNFDTASTADLSGHGNDAALQGNATIATIVGVDPVHALCYGRYTELGSLPRPTASERLEVFDANSKTLFSFPSYDNGDLNVVYASRLMTNMLSPWSQTTALNDSKTYWGRGVSDGTNLFFGGGIDSALLSVARITNGGLAQWQTTTEIPTIEGGRGRSLHQTFCYQGRLYVLGGWYGDGEPGYDDVTYASILPDGTLSAFASTTPLPLPMWGHSAVVSPEGKIYLVKSTNLFVAQIRPDGAVGPWLKQPTINGLNHNNYGNVAIAVVRNLLVIVDDSNTHLCRLNSSGFFDSLYASVTNPATFLQRSVFVDNTNAYVTATSGKLYRIDNLPMSDLAPFGMVAWWTGDGTTDDETGVNPLTLLHGATYGTGLVDRSLHFDGTDDSAFAPAHPSLNISNAITLEAWVRHDALGTNIQRYITLAPEKAQLRYDGVAGNKGFHFSIKVSGIFYQQRPGIMPSIGVWHHVVGTYDGAVQKLYVDGSLARSRAITGTLDPQNTTSAVISATAEPMNGNIDEAIIYNRALSEDEIKSHYQAKSFGLSKTPRLTLTLKNTPQGVGSLTVSGKQGVHRIETSTNLVTWSTIGIVTNLTDAVPFSDPATNQSGFYRVVSP